jgi:hypothetical protein
MRQLGVNNTAYFSLEQDIKIFGDAWLPLDSFSGVLEGNGYTITGLKVPLFSELNGAEIRNLKVEGDIEDFEYNYATGLLAAQADASVLDNITAQGSINRTCTDSYTYMRNYGLIAGNIINSVATINLHADGTITATDCRAVSAGLVVGSVDTASFLSATGSLTLTFPTNNSFAGGVAGEVTSAITDSYAKAAITAHNTIGGLVGRVSDYGVVERSFATGNMISDRRSGGLIGQIFRGTVKDSYATGNVSGNIAGGLTATQNNNGGGFEDQTLIITNCYATGTATADSIATGIIPSGTQDDSRTVLYATGNLALGSAVTATNAYRIGSDAGIPGVANYAYKYMSVNITYVSSTDPASNDGADIELSDLTSNFLTGIGFDSGVWDFDYSSRTYKLPVLKSNIDAQKALPMPAHLSN